MRINDDGTLDYEMDDYVPPAAPDAGTDPAAPTSRTARGDPADQSTTSPNQDGGQGASMATPEDAFNVGDWVTQALGTAKSTDDPAYWNGKVGGDPNVQNATTRASALNYWQGLINQGNGNGLGNALRNDSPAGGAAGGGSASPAGAGGTLSDFLNSLLSQYQTNSANTSSQRNSLLQRLSGLIDQYSQPVTADDPGIKAATDAYTGDVNRATNAYQKQAAERSYAEGVPSGAFDSAIGNATMAGGKAIGDYQGNLINTETQNRRSAVTSLAGQELGALGGEDSTSLESMLAGLNSNEFYDQLGTSTAYNESMLKYLYTALGLQA